MGGWCGWWWLFVMKSSVQYRKSSQNFHNRGLAKTRSLFAAQLDCSRGPPTALFSLIAFAASKVLFMTLHQFVYMLTQQKEFLRLWNITGRKIKSYLPHAQLQQNDVHEQREPLLSQKYFCAIFVNLKNNTVFSRFYSTLPSIWKCYLVLHALFQVGLVCDAYVVTYFPKNWSFKKVRSDATVLRQKCITFFSCELKWT